MQADPLSNEVRTFLLECVHTYEQLDVLLLLYRTSGEWSATRVANELNIEVDVALAALLHLESHHLLHSNGGNFHFSAKTKELSDCTAALSAAYAQSRLVVISTMNGNALARVRTSGLRMFSAAFRLRGKG